MVRVHLGLDPVACPRPRLTRYGGVYYPKTYSSWKAAAARMLPGALWDAGLHQPLQGPLLVALELVVTRPKSTKLAYPKPDIDNYCKSVLDALNGLAWIDDEQVIGLAAEKRWAPPGKSGFIHINISEFTE